MSNKLYASVWGIKEEYFLKVYGKPKHAKRRIQRKKANKPIQGELQFLKT